MGFGDNLSSLETLVVGAEINVLDPPSQCFLQDLQQLVEDNVKTTVDLETREEQVLEEWKAAKEKLTAFEKERAILKKDLEKLKKDDEIAVKQLHKIKRDINALSLKIRKAETKSNLTSKDKYTLEKNMNEMKAYHKLTGIRWDVSIIDTHIGGLHTNSSTLAVKVFEYDKTQYTKPQIQKNLWALLRDSASKGWNKESEKDKENVPNNET